MDGPYGCMPDFCNEAEVLVLIAGGIGVTPLMAVFAQLFARARAASALAATLSAGSSSISVNGPSEPSSSSSSALLGASSSSSSSAGVYGMGRLRRVVLSWTVRTACELQPFAELLWHVSQNNPFDAFELDLHVTQPDAAAADAAGPAAASTSAKSSAHDESQARVG